MNTVNGVTYRKGGANEASIRRQIRAAIDSFLESIDDGDIVTSMKKDIIVTGGCIASMLLGEQVNDYDVYFRTKETAASVANYYAKKYLYDSNDNKEFCLAELKGTSDVDHSDPYPYISIKQHTDIKGGLSDRISVLPDKVAVYTCNNHTSATKPKVFTPSAISFEKIQIVLRFYGEAEEIHKYFDFVHCTNYYDYNTDKLVLNQNALYSILTKNLKYNGSLYPICSILRTRKFLARNWIISAPQMMKMIIQTQSVNLKDRHTLWDQLVSVDALYFQEFFNRIQSEEDVDTAYLAEIMEDVFENFNHNSE